MKSRDLAALAALIGGAAALKRGSDDKKDVSGSKFMEAFNEIGGKDSRDEYRKATPEELKRAKRKVIEEEPELKNVVMDSSDIPVSSGSGYLKSRQYKKGGTASSRADGCVMRGKTRGRIV